MLFDSCVRTPSCFSDVVVTTKALNLRPLLSPNGNGSFTLVSSRPSERPDLKKVLIQNRLSTLLISSLRPFEYGMMAVAIGLSSSSLSL